jgi:hypothetical protein
VSAEADSLATRGVELQNLVLVIECYSVPIELGLAQYQVVSSGVCHKELDLLLMVPVGKRNRGNI